MLQFVFLVLSLTAVASAQSVAITSISNAASLTPAALPAGGLAQGAIFSIAGTGLGPGDPSNPASGIAGSLPYDTNLSGVTIDVTQGDTTVSAYPIYVWANRVDAILPSSAPLGPVTITVTSNGVASPSIAATVVASNFGAYSTNGLSGGRGVIMVQATPTDTGKPNSDQVTAIPGQMVLLIGTGLGPISSPDNDVPPPDDLGVSLQVLVGGVAATPLHAGRVPNQPGKDQIQFVVPADAPAGCNTPVQVVTGGNVYSNVVTMAIDPNGLACSTINPWTSLADQGGNIGNIFLLRSNANVLIAADQPSVSIRMDEGLAVFSKSPAGGGPLLSLLASLPTLNTCGALSGIVNPLALLSGGLSGLALGNTINYLDAGSSINVLGTGLRSQLSLGTNPDGSPVTTPGAYSAVGGGLATLFGLPATPLFLGPGFYILAGNGGADVGPFTSTFSVPQQAAWTNPDALASIDHTAGFPVTWAGGNSSQLVMTAGFALDPASSSTTGFVCLSPATQGSFTVPASAVANLPVAGPPGSSGVLGVLIVGTVPAGPSTRFIAPGLDSGMVFYGNFDVQRIAIQ